MQSKMVDMSDPEEQVKQESTLDREQVLKELLEEVDDPVHKRIVQAYSGDNPVESMEIELNTILLEVFRGED